jgi:hypothetical protein
VKALSIIQPWATLIAIGAKRVETRSWSTPYRGPVAIHASKWLTSTGRIINAQVASYLSLCHQEPFRSALTLSGIERVQDLPSGAIVATARLVEVVSTETFQPDDYERALGNYAARRYAWRLSDVMPLPAPITHRGFQGLWDLDDAVLVRPAGGGDVSTAEAEAR